MAKPERKGSRKTPKAKSASGSSVRDGGTRLSVRNSGLEVWLYDDANRGTIRDAGETDSGFGGMPAAFPELTRQGIVVGYSLYQDRAPREDLLRFGISGHGLIGSGVRGREAGRLPLPKALDILDRRLAKMGLAPQGDVSWQERIRVRSVEATCRLYAGLPDGFGAILVGDGCFELMFLSELDDGTWVVTGLADELDRRIMTKGPDGLPVPPPRVWFQTMDESLAKIFAAHKKALRTSKRHPVAPPKTLDECVAGFERFLTVAFDRISP